MKTHLEHSASIEYSILKLPMFYTLEFSVGLRYAKQCQAILPHGASLPVLGRFAPASGLEASARAQQTNNLVITL